MGDDWVPKAEVKGGRGDINRVICQAAAQPQGQTLMVRLPITIVTSHQQYNKPLTSYFLYQSPLRVNWKSLHSAQKLHQKSLSPPAETKNP